jgi:hypothetical protein
VSIILDSLGVLRAVSERAIFLDARVIPGLLLIVERADGSVTRVLGGLLAPVADDLSLADLLVGRILGSLRLDLKRSDRLIMAGLCDAELVVAGGLSLSDLIGVRVSRCLGFIVNGPDRGIVRVRRRLELGILALFE